MSKYEPLAQFLDRQTSSVWQAEFMAIEHILGFPLPKSAHEYPAWWANQGGNGHSQTSGWRAVGWRTSNIDLPGKKVTFERAPDQRGAKSDPVLDRARLVTGMDDADGLMVRALQDFAAGEAINYLNALGGTMPDFQPAPRDRPGL